ncbi:MAG: hypothetical protein RR554_08085 [Vagococcus sp.]|uniref:hypothetical protein n=1 Tax=Vagococcus sp. TaxID=1933889 RepID=UPI002FC61645
MTTDEKILNCLESTLKKMEELSNKLGKIELNTKEMDQKQSVMEQQVVRLLQVNENNNVM